MNPKVGEYWYILVKRDCLKIPVLAKCVSITDEAPIFIGKEYSYNIWDVVYGSLGFSYDLLYKWEPNWFWKLLGYK